MSLSDCVISEKRMCGLLQRNLSDFEVSWLS